MVTGCRVEKKESGKDTEAESTKEKKGREDATLTQPCKGGRNRGTKFPEKLLCP